MVYIEKSLVFGQFEYYSLIAARFVKRKVSGRGNFGAYVKYGK